MADEKKERGRKPLAPEPLVESLMPDPSQHAGAMAIVGFLGRSPRSGYWRLYMSPELSDYVEFGEADVVHTLPLSTQQSPLGGTSVWLKRDTELVYTRTVSLKAQAEFLQGPIMQDWMPDVGVQGLSIAAAAGRPGSPGFGCAISNLLGCASHNNRCYTYQKAASRTSCCLCPADPT